MEIIAQGAEAILIKEKDNLIKHRIKKGYRIKEIDEPLRKLRTRNEAKLLNEASRAGLNTPKVLEVNEKECKILMEFIEGKRLKELLNDNSDKEKLSQQIGEGVGILHNRGIVHGDLTTSNMIQKNNKIYFIDFGLGFFTQRLEDFGTDLTVLKEAFKSTHFNDMELIWKNFIIGYGKTCKKSKEILNVLKKIETRGRYVKRNN